MNRAEFEQDLQGFFHNEAGKVKHSEGWWDNVVSKATTEEPGNSCKKTGFFRKKMLLIPASILVVLLIITGNPVSGYSSYLKERIDIMVPYTVNEETGEKISMGQEYDLSQTIDDITASLVCAYSDMNTVVVGVSVENWKGYYSVRLYTKDGQKLDMATGLGSSGGDWVIRFHPPSVQGNPSSLDLHMEISVSEDMEPFVFDFEAPYYGGKVINVGQTVEAAGVTIELESLLISPGETLAIFNLSPQTDERGSYAAPAPVYIKLPDGSVVHACLDAGNNLKGEPATEYFINNLAEQYGEWIITVETLAYAPPLTSDAPLQTFAAEEFVYLTGPWVFTVQVD